MILKYKFLKNAKFLHSLEYDTKQRTLIVKRKNGTIEEYDAITKSQYEEFTDAVSPDSWLIKNFGRRKPLIHKTGFKEETEENPREVYY